MLILADLYVGEVRPGERSGNCNQQYKKALNDAIKAGDALTASLTEQQKELFEEYMTAQREINILTDVETYIYSGAKIMLDVLTDGQMKEI